MFLILVGREDEGLLQLYKASHDGCLCCKPVQEKAGNRARRHWRYLTSSMLTYIKKFGMQKMRFCDLIKSKIKMILKINFPHYYLVWYIF